MQSKYNTPVVSSSNLPSKPSQKLDHSLEKSQFYKSIHDHSSTKSPQRTAYKNIEVGNLTWNDTSRLKEEDKESSASELDIQRTQSLKKTIKGTQKDDQKSETVALDYEEQSLSSARGEATKPHIHLSILSFS